MKETFTRGLASVEKRFDRLGRALSSRWGSSEPLHVLPFRGYGTRERLWLKGRVLQAESVPKLPEEDAGTLENLRAMLRRYETDEIADAHVRARIGRQCFDVTTDEEGYFDLVVDDPEDVESPWTDVELELLEPRVKDRGAVRATGRIRVPGPSARFGVISDMDDTVIKTGATDVLRSLRTILLNNARSREPFSGIAPFYRALASGSGGEDNPIFYVSSSPWNVFDLFDCFLELHDIPSGPILLKDFGLEEDKLLKSGHVEYKARRIERILETYPDLRFILLGDSGQKDAWVFERVVEENPGRILCAYLRDLDPNDADPEIERIEHGLATGGVTMMRVPDTAAAADHACEQGLITATARDEVRQAVRREATEA